MITTFVDTGYLVALIDVRDSLHAPALEVARELARRSARLVTSDAVLIELGNYFARSPLRSTAIDWILAMRASPGWQIVPIASSILTRAEALYRAHSDKTWSVTDCASMEIMRDARIQDVATPDRGFAQAGFRVLLAHTRTPSGPR